MKIIFVFLMTAVSSFAQAEAGKSALKVDVNFELASAKKSFQVKASTLIPDDRASWVPLTPATEGVALLGKFERLQQGTFRATYMIVDTSVTPVAVYSMSLVTSENLAAKVSMSSDDEVLTVGVLGRPATIN